MLVEICCGESDVGKTSFCQLSFYMLEERRIGQPRVHDREVLSKGATPTTTAERANAQRHSCRAAN